jgi:putative membrane protein
MTRGMRSPSRCSGWSGGRCSIIARPALELLRLLARQKEFIAIEQRERPQVPLGDVPDLPLRVGHDKIALAGLRRVVAAQDFVNECGVEVGFVDRMGMRDLPRCHWDNLNEKPIGQRHLPQDKPETIRRERANCSAPASHLQVVAPETKERAMINSSRVISIAAVTAIAAAAAIAIPPSTQPADTGATTRPISSADRAFIDQAARGGLSEVTLGRLAAQRAVNPQVKQLGQMMVDDHSQANSELLSLAMDRGLKPPKEMEPDSQALSGQLNLAKGADFDRTYVNAMVDDHRKDVDAFKKEADSGEDTVIKAWANRMLPTLQHHLSMAEDLQRSLNQPLEGAQPAGGKSGAGQ